MNQCQELGACSLYGDLAGASGETLEMYRREKAQDGTVFSDTRLPGFEGIDPDASIGEVIDSHLVPTYLFVNRDGDVEEKLVGMKTRDEVVAFVGAHLDHELRGE